MESQCCDVAWQNCIGPAELALHMLSTRSSACTISWFSPGGPTREAYPFVYICRVWRSYALTAAVQSGGTYVQEGAHEGTPVLRRCVIKLHRACRARAAHAVKTLRCLHKLLVLP